MHRLTHKFKTQYTYKEVCRGIVNAFDSFTIDETIRKPRVGIVGEILVKYMPLANNHLVELLEREGAEVVVPDLLDFFNYCVSAPNTRRNTSAPKIFGHRIQGGNKADCRSAQTGN